MLPSCKILALILMLLVILGPTAYAHGGGLDANGGHKDTNNVSGMGPYHYHCDGHEAHLHPDGVCPYENENHDEQQEDKELQKIREKFDRLKNDDVDELVESKRTLKINPLALGTRILIVVLMGLYVMRVLKNRKVGKR